MLDGGVVYAVLVGEAVKIGFTQNLPSRLKAYGHPRVLALVDCPESEAQSIRPRRLEQSWHRHARPFQLHGEWYRPDPALLDWLQQQGKAG